ncbi:hypothetical protein [Ponticaulis profundi]|uniref:Phage gp6-like head-tail connector protein n=1 Tax=Ponticaulis profundi TaxID=2665222 RepID=A0ABW1S826_9PROT
MSALISLDTLRFRARVDFTDTELQGIADDATAIVVDFLKKPDHEWTIETVPGEIRSAIVRVAVLMLDQTTSDKQVEFIDKGVKDLLRRHRDPALK